MLGSTFFFSFDTSELGQLFSLFEPRFPHCWLDITLVPISQNLCVRVYVWQFWELYFSDSCEQ
jgi:hypothetical protein